MNETGIYEIKNSANGKTYIGSAVSFSKRWATHKYKLSLGKHANKYLQSSWDKYGKDAFSFRRLLICNKDNLLMYEQIAIDEISPEYNIAKNTSAPMLGRKHSPEARQKITTAQIGRYREPLSEGAKAHLSAINTGKHLSPETRKKIGDSSRGRKLSIEHRKKLSEARAGRSFGPLSAEHRAKIGRPCPPERRAEISASLIGNKRKAGMKDSAETIARKSMAQKGIPWSEKRRAAYIISKAQK